MIDDSTFTLDRIFAMFTDAQRMQYVLGEAVNQLWRSPVTILHCEIAHAWQKTYAKHTSLHKSYLSVCYRLRLAPSEDKQPFTTLVHGTVYPGPIVADAEAIAPDCVVCQIDGATILLRAFPNDPALPQLATLVEPSRALESLRRASHTPLPETQIEHSEVVYYRPAIRCALRYALSRETQAMPTSVFAKTYCDSTGLSVYQRMIALSHYTASSAASLQIAQPIGYDAETNTVWQHFVEGVSAAHVIQSQKTSSLSVVRSAIRSVAALHKAPFTVATITSREMLVRDTAKRVAKLCLAYPAFAAKLNSTMQLCKAAAVDLPAMRPALVHGDAHLGQFLIHQGRTVTVDWDELTMADAEQDLASLILDFQLLGITCDLPALTTDAAAEFYATANHHTISRSLLIWHLCLHCLTKCYRLHWRAEPNRDSRIAMLADWALGYAQSMTNETSTTC